MNFAGFIFTLNKMEKEIDNKGFDDLVGKNTIADLVFVKLKNKTAVYASIIDHKNKAIITKTIFEATNTGDFKDMLQDLNIDHIDSEDDE